MQYEDDALAKTIAGAACAEMIGILGVRNEGAAYVPVGNNPRMQDEAQR